MRDGWEGKICSKNRIFKIFYNVTVTLYLPFMPSGRIYSVYSYVEKKICIFFVKHAIFTFGLIDQLVGLQSKGHLGLGYLGLGTHLFVKVPRPEDNKVIFSVFESSCHLLLPV